MVVTNPAGAAMIEFCSPHAHPGVVSDNRPSSHVPLRKVLGLPRRFGSCFALKLLCDTPVGRTFALVLDVRLHGVECLDLGNLVFDRILAAHPSDQECVVSRLWS